MSTAAVFGRMVAYGLALGALDAVFGRTLQAAPDPSFLLPLGATVWASHHLTVSGRANIAVPAGFVLWAAFMVGFSLCARALVGWNGTMPWHPQSTAWLVWFGVAAVAVALAARFGASRAARQAAQKSAGTPA